MPTTGKHSSLFLHRMSVKVKKIFVTLKLVIFGAKYLRKKLCRVLVGQILEFAKLVPFFKTYLEAFSLHLAKH